VDPDYTADNFQTDLTFTYGSLVGMAFSIPAWIASTEDPAGELKAFAVRIAENEGKELGLTVATNIVLGPLGTMGYVARWLAPWNW
jgi:hypothetical protein